MRELDLTSHESIEFAKPNAGVVQPSKTSISPYCLGLKMLEDIEERYNNPTEEMKKLGVKPNSGREKIFEVANWKVTHLSSEITLQKNLSTEKICIYFNGKEEITRLWIKTRLMSEINSLT